MYKLDDRDILLCDCESPEHLMLFYFEGIESYPMVYVSIHLKKLPWYKRVIHGIKYIFGHQSKYGAFDEFILNKDDKHKLEGIIKYLDSK